MACIRQRLPAIPYEAEPVECYQYEEWKNRAERQAIEQELSVRTDEAVKILLRTGRWERAGKGVAWAATRRLEFGVALAAALAQCGTSREDALLRPQGVMVGEVMEWLCLDAWKGRSGLLGFRDENPYGSWD